MAAINKTELFLKILITFVVRENKCEGMQWCGIVSSIQCKGTCGTGTFFNSISHGFPLPSGGRVDYQYICRNFSREELPTKLIAESLFQIDLDLEKDKYKYTLAKNPKIAFKCKIYNPPNVKLVGNVLCEIQSQNFPAAVFLLERDPEILNQKIE